MIAYPLGAAQFYLSDRSTGRCYDRCMSASVGANPGLFIYRPVDSDGGSHEVLRDAGCLVTLGDGRAICAQAAPLHDVHALLGSTHLGDPIGSAEFDRWPQLRLVAKYTIGTDDVDIAAASERGILVTHCPTEANWGGVAEGTVAMILALLKRLLDRDRVVKAGGWRDPELEGTYLGSREDGYCGITIGIIGFGRVGRRLARLLEPWQVNLLATDPYVDQQVVSSYGVRPVTLDALLEQSDVVTVHCNLTEETRGLLAADTLGKLKPGAVLVNTARGAIMDIDAVCNALDSGALASVALDVFADEPLPPGHRIRSFGDRALLSPHMIAANAGGTLAAAVPWATQAVLDALRGRVPGHVYNVEAIDLWCERFRNTSLIAASV